jgi:aspartate kinase
MALDKAGCNVQAVCPSGHPLAKTSVVAQTHRYHGLAPLRSFAKAIIATKPDFIVPCDDLATRHLHLLYQRQRPLGKAGESICTLIERSLGSAESFPVVFARTAFMEVAQADGIRVPRTEVIGNSSDLKKWVAQVGLPTALKADGTSGGDGVRLVRTMAEAEHALRSLQAPPLLARALKRAFIDQDKTLVCRSLFRHQSVVNGQVFIAGHEATSAVVCCNGTVLASLHFEVLNKADSAGHATVVRLIEHAEMSAATEKIVRRLNLSGLHGFDFMLETSTGHAYLIEINPRTTQVGHLALGPGRDLPAALHSALSGQTVRAAGRVTENDTIALFPQEWIRDVASPFLQSAYHDVPWEEPELVRACLDMGQEQRGWYSPRSEPGTFFGGSQSVPLAAAPMDLAVSAESRSAMNPDIPGEPAPQQSSPPELGMRSFSACTGGTDEPRASAEPLAWAAAGSNGVCRSTLLGRNAARKGREDVARHTHWNPAAQVQVTRNAGKALRIMKFGGTSVGDASCIARVTEIIQSNARAGDVVVVVSAMGGVTNKLVEAATQSAAGDRDRVAMIFRDLRKQHYEVINALLPSAVKREHIRREMEQLFQEAEQLCESASLSHELTLQEHDSISSTGERLSAPLVAAALAEAGVRSEAIDAVELVVTNSNHGAADPWMDPTRQRCEARLRPLLRLGIVPVVTGFIGATTEGVLTTLGRGGSDYSAAIIGAALDADEVTIWTDVDGMLTADPHLVPGACTISAISYHEAAELAHFGAKVLHPKTLRPIMDCGIPLFIRNTFAPERSGTKITSTGPPSKRGVRALASLSEIALIKVSGPGVAGVSDVLARALRTTATARADMLLASHSSSPNDICLIVRSALATPAVEALRLEFAQEMVHERVEQITVDSKVAIVTVVGHNMPDRSGIAGRAFRALGRESVNIIAIAEGTSEGNISFVVASKDVKAALVTTHGEFHLGVQEFANASHADSL